MAEICTLFSLPLFFLLAVRCDIEIWAAFVISPLLRVLLLAVLPHHCTSCSFPLPSYSFLPSQMKEERERESGTSQPSKRKKKEKEGPSLYST